jgi:hypothetical protein
MKRPLIGITTIAVMLSVRAGFTTGGLGSDTNTFTGFVGAVMFGGAAFVGVQADRECCRQTQTSISLRR